MVFRIPHIQTKVAKAYSNLINERYKTNISIDKISFTYSGDIALKSLNILDHKKDTLFFVKTIQTTAFNFPSLFKGDIDFNSILLKDANVFVKKHKSDSISNFKIFLKKWSAEKNRSLQNLTSMVIKIESSSFSYVDESNKKNNFFLTDLSLLISEIKQKKNNTSLNIAYFNFSSDQFINLNNFEGSVTIFKNQIRLNTFVLKTKNSLLKGTLFFNLNKDNLPNFLNINLVNSEIGQDILLKFDKKNHIPKVLKIKVDLTAIGPMNTLDIKSLGLSSLSSNLSLKGQLNNFFNPEKPSVIDSEIANLSFSKKDMLTFFPQLSNRKEIKSIDSLAVFSTQGRYFQTNDSINTKLALSFSGSKGLIALSLNKINNLDKITYKGQLVMDSLNLEKLFNIKGLKYANFDVDIKGTGLKNLTSSVYNSQIKLHTLNYKNTFFNDITLSVKKANQTVSINAFSNKPDHDFNLETTFDLSKKTGKIFSNFNALKLNLLANRYQKDKTTFLSGSLESEFNYINTYSGIEGVLAIDNLKVHKTDTTLVFEKFKLTSFNSNKIKTIRVSSPDFINGFYKGYLENNQVTKFFRNAFGSIYEKHKPFRISPNQFIQSEFKVFKKALSVFFPEIAISDHTLFNCYIKPDENILNVKFKTDSIRFKNYVLANLRLNIDNKKAIKTSLFVAKINLGFYSLDSINLKNQIIKDSLFFNISLKGGKNNIDDYKLAFNYSLGETYTSTFEFKKADIVFNANLWRINTEKKNQIRFSSKLDSININNLTLEAKKQQISLNGYLYPKNKKATFNTKNLLLESILPPNDSLKLKGVINSSAHLVKTKNNLIASSKLTIDSLSLNNQQMGDLLFSSISNNNSLSQGFFNLQLVKNNEETFSLISNVFEEKEQSRINAQIITQNFNINGLKTSGNNINKIRGFINGNVHITGNLSNPLIAGNLQIKDTGLSLPYQNLDLVFNDNTTIKFDNNFVYFDNTLIRDRVYNTTSFLTGNISHQNFKNLAMNIQISTKDDKTLLLNTKRTSDNGYYGTAFFRGNLELTGSLQELFVDIKGETRPGTKLTIPVKKQIYTDDTFITFNYLSSKKLSRKNTNVKKIFDDKTYKGLELKLDLEVNENTDFEILMDENSNTNIVGKAKGQLFINTGEYKDLDIKGKLTIVSGIYNFKYLSFASKKIQVQPGGIINWSGDLYKVDLQNLKAIYTLYANPDILLEVPQYNRKIKTDVILNIQGDFNQPITKFDITFPENTNFFNSDLQFHLKDYERREIQALSLLSQGTFINKINFTQYALRRNLTESAFNALDNIINDDVSKVKVGISYESDENLLEEDFQLKDRIGVNLSSQINSKVLVNGRIGVPINNSTANSFAGEGEIEFLLNKQNTLSAKLFSRRSQFQNTINTEQYTRGAGLTYKVNFNTINELFYKILYSKKQSKKTAK